MNFKLTCEMCRREIEHRATVEQYQRLLRKLHFEFACPVCSTPIQVRMLDNGVSCSTLLPTSRSQGAAAVQPDVPRLPGSSPSPADASGFRGDGIRVTVAAEAQDTPSRDPEFEPIRGAPVRRPRGGSRQRFFDWYSKQPTAMQWVVLSPLLVLLVLLLLWDPRADSRPTSDTVSQEPADGSVSKPQETGMTQESEEPKASQMHAAPAVSTETPPGAAADK